MRLGLSSLALIGVGGATTVGCLDRPVSELTPNTSNLFVDQITANAVDKIDLLFMIDNSASMADKQEVLRQAVPDLVSRLVNPFCVDKDGTVVAGQPTNADADCPAASEREFKPIKDFHLGVISSSIGDAGANTVSNCEAGTPPGDDSGRLMGSVRSGLAGNAEGFLAWNGGDETATAALISDFQGHVSGAGEAGCGYEASLEAWYRFLVDPRPPASLKRGPCREGDTSNGCVVRDGLDEVLLAQRAEFLRPDSLLAVIMLTDENDCSIQQGGQFWFAADTGAFKYRPTASCESDANSECCYSCAQGQVAGCPDKATECAGPPPGGDNANLRCWDQKRRAGIDFLYPVDRYVEGLSKPQVTTGYRGCDAQKEDNPLYIDIKGAGRPVRDPSLVFFAGIVGVPWQDIATNAETCAAIPNDEACPPADGSLKYLTAPQMSELGRWKTILGEPVAVASSGCESRDVRTRHQHANPEDPFMIETAFERSGSNPITGDTLPGDNGLNGRDYSTAAGAENSDLQYACIFDLPAGTNPCDSGSCDCETDADLASGKPLCQAKNVQDKAKAYPGTRLLSALKGYGDNSIVASICPKTLAAGAADYGYRPAVTAIIDRLKEALSGRCLPRQLKPDADQLVQCKIIEATSQPGIDCSRPGRADPEPAVTKAVKAELTKSERCGGSTGVDCDGLAYCEIQQATGDQLTECLQQEVTQSVTGWCYIDANQGNPALIESCKATEKQLLRFVGKDTPLKGATTFIACKGASLDDSIVVTSAN